jgi:hypothetical protein
VIEIQAEAPGTLLFSNADSPFAYTKKELASFTPL